MSEENSSEKKFRDLLKIFSGPSLDKVLTSLGVSNIEQYDKFVKGFLDPTGGYLTIGLTGTQRTADPSAMSVIDLITSTDFTSTFTSRDVRVLCYTPYAGTSKPVKATTTKTSFPMAQDINGYGIINWASFPLARPKKCSNTLVYGVLNASIDTANTQDVALFMNSLPTHVASNLVPYLDVEFEMSEAVSSKTDARGRRVKTGLPKFFFMEKRSDLSYYDQKMFDAQNFTLTEGEFTKRYSYLGMEAFSAPQTLFNQGIRTSSYLVDVLNPTAPIASVTSLNITITPAGTGGGLARYKTAKLELMIHDKSRMDQFSEILDPSNYNDVILWLTYGWRYKAYIKPEERLDPYSDFINSKMMWKEAWRLITSSYTLEGNGVRVVLDLSTENFKDYYDKRLTTLGSEVTYSQIDVGGGKDLTTLINELKSTMEQVKDALDLVKGPEAAARVFNGVALEALALRYPQMKTEDDEGDDGIEEGEKTYLDIQRQIEEYITELGDAVEGSDPARGLLTKVSTIQDSLLKVFQPSQSVDEEYGNEIYEIPRKFKSKLKAVLEQKFKTISEKEDPFLYSEYNNDEFRYGLSMIDKRYKDRVEFEKSLGAAFSSTVQPLPKDLGGVLDKDIWWDNSARPPLDWSKNKYGRAIGPEFEKIYGPGNLKWDPIDKELRKACTYYGVEYDVMRALFDTESSYLTQGAWDYSFLNRSSANALGIGQLTHYGVTQMSEITRLPDNYIHPEDVGGLKLAKDKKGNIAADQHVYIWGPQLATKQYTWADDIRFNPVANVWLSCRHIRMTYALVLAMISSRGRAFDQAALTDDRLLSAITINAYNMGAPAAVKQLSNMVVAQMWTKVEQMGEGRYYHKVNESYKNKVKTPTDPMPPIIIGASNAASAITVTSKGVSVNTSGLQSTTTTTAVRDLVIPSYIFVSSGFPHYGEGKTPTGPYMAGSVDLFKKNPPPFSIDLQFQGVATATTTTSGGGKKLFSLDVGQGLYPDSSSQDLARSELPLGYSDFGKTFAFVGKSSASGDATPYLGVVGYEYSDSETYAGKQIWKPAILYYYLDDIDVKETQVSTWQSLYVIDARTDIDAAQVSSYPADKAEYDKREREWYGKNVDEIKDDKRETSEKLDREKKNRDHLQAVLQETKRQKLADEVEYYRSIDRYNSIGGDLTRLAADVTSVIPGLSKVSAALNDPNEALLSYINSLRLLIFNAAVSIGDLESRIKKSGEYIKSLEDRIDYEAKVLTKLTSGTLTQEFPKAFDYKYKMVSYGSLFNYFVMPEIASIKMVDEVQALFGELNRNASCYSQDGSSLLKLRKQDGSTVANLNVAEFPIDIEALYLDIHQLSFNRGNNRLTLGDFISTLNAQVNDFKKGVPYYSGDEELGTAKTAVSPTTSGSTATGASSPTASTAQPPGAGASAPSPVSVNQGNTASGGIDDERPAAKSVVFVSPQVSLEIATFPLKKNLNSINDLLDSYEASYSIERSGYGKIGNRIMRVKIVDSANKMSPRDLIKNSIANKKMLTAASYTGAAITKKLIEFGIPINLSSVKGISKDATLNNELLRGLTLRESQELIENSFSNLLPTIVIGAEGSTITNVSVTTNADKLDASSRMLQKSDPNKPAAMELIPYLPSRIYPGKLSITSLGCPLVEFAQTYFIKIGTHTDLDNQYGIGGITHNLTPGKFTSNIEFLVIDMYGAFRQEKDPVALIDSLQYTFGGS